MRISIFKTPFDLRSLSSIVSTGLSDENSRQNSRLKFIEGIEYRDDPCLNHRDFCRHSLLSQAL